MDEKYTQTFTDVNRHTFGGVVHNPGMKTVGDRIRELRRARKLTQEQLAQALGIKQGSLTQLETGVSKAPSSATLTKLARLFEVDPEWLMTGKGQQYPVATLSDQESELVLLFRSLSNDGRQYILGRANAMQRAEHVPMPKTDGERAQEPRRKRH